MFQIHLSHMPWLPEEGQVASNECDDQPSVGLHRSAVEGSWSQTD